MRSYSHLRRLVPAIVLLLCLASAVRADDAPDGWTEYQSDRGGFTVLMPPGEARTIERPAGEMGEITERRFVLSGGSGYLVNLTLFKPDTIDPVSAFFLLTADNLVDLDDGDTVRVERRFELDSNAAVEIVIDKADGRTKSLRAYAVGDHAIIQMVVLGPKGSDASADTRLFLDSFRLVSP